MERLNGLELDVDIETMFKVEPPLTPAPSNFGYIGVILRNKITDKLQCHICGEWFLRLSHHVRTHEGIKVIDYKTMFSLPRNFPLVGRSISKKISEWMSKPEINKRLIKNLEDLHAARDDCRKKNRELIRTRQKEYYKTEAYLNTKGLCDKQMESRYLSVSDIVGRLPTVSDIMKYDPNLFHAIRIRFKNINTFREKIGMPTQNPNFRKFSDQKLIGELRKFKIDNGRNPRAKDFENKSPYWTTFVGRFGSWRRALVMAGLN